MGGRSSFDRTKSAPAGSRRATRNYFTKSRMIATRKAKMPRPSASAAPMNARPNWPSEADGLRSAPERKLPKIVPTPTAAAPMPIAARPAPTYLAATGSILELHRILKGDHFLLRDLSVARLNCVVVMDASEDGEHIRLKHSDQQFERGQENDADQRQRREQRIGAGAE